MKIEMGESLFYSWLRHVKACQLVQMNWKASPNWPLNGEENLEKMMALLDRYYREAYGYAIFKQNTSLSQLLLQGECDVLGLSTGPDGVAYYAVEVAFHEGGLNYGGRSATVMKILEKCARTAFCLSGYLSTETAEIIFASPKIHPAIVKDLMPCIADLNTRFAENGYGFTFRVLANEAFQTQVLDPILQVSDRVADTTELFLRSYQMYKMFSR